MTLEDIYIHLNKDFTKNNYNYDSLFLNGQDYIQIYKDNFWQLDNFDKNTGFQRLEIRCIGGIVSIIPTPYVKPGDILTINHKDYPTWENNIKFNNKLDKILED
jgi:hypothetical protein